MERQTALGLLNYANSYLTAAKHMVSELIAGRLQLRFDAPLELLVGHGLEILLKSYLRSEGADDAELIRLGHDLEELLSEAQRRGLDMIPSDVECGHLKLLNQTYGKPPYLVRYLQTGCYTAHDDTIVIGFAQRIESHIRPSIEASYRP